MPLSLQSGCRSVKYFEGESVTVLVEEFVLCDCASQHSFKYNAITTQQGMHTAICQFDEAARSV